MCIRDSLPRWSRARPGRGACGLLDAAAGTAGSLLRAFPERIPLHLGAACPACATDLPADGPGRLAVAVPEVADAPSARIAPSPPPVLPALKGTP
ncbi:hypothetical protein ACFXA3_37735 [Streptomyces sp. NPDC059456]|uniref:hypothetical protein n=1 Tax=Streptomyces sp. NPDC059456 TaxID=3346838 RepID=UPI0036C37BCF